MSDNGNRDEPPLFMVQKGRGGDRRHPHYGLPNLYGPRVFLEYLFGSGFAMLLVAVFGGVMLAVHVHVNIWWFEGAGLGSVYGTIWNTEKNLFLVFWTITYMFLSTVFLVTRGFTFRPGIDEDARRLDPPVVVGVGFLVALISVSSAHVMASFWQQYLLAAHSQTFGTTDPIHHRDIGFYVFALPWRETLAGYAATVLFLGAAGLAAVASLYTFTSPSQTPESDYRRALRVGSLLGSVLFGYLAWRNFYLNPFDLQQPGRAYGGGATFVHSTLWWMPIVGVVEALTALVLLVNTFLSRATLAALAVLPIVVGLASSAGQGIFQKFVVAPNELSAEYKYLGYTLNSTRQAFGLDKWGASEYTPQPLALSDIGANAHSVSDARIADAGAFTQVVQQRQENRTYYTFNTADLDRYNVNGASRQVLLAARELAYWKLSAEAQTWVNEHIKFTHGYGLTMAPANTVSRDGQPVLWIQNVPVQETVSGLPPVQQPRVYFGEYTDSWILTGATTPEFDSARADQDTSYRYAGPDGIPVGSGLKRLTLSWNIEGGFPFFSKLNISNYVGSSTRVLLHRNIMDRVATIAPWLTLSSDPYLVVRQDGSLVWLIDGVTRTDHYPYSEPQQGDNYRRNSVKVALDAYTGRATFYMFDETDPIVRAWSAVFPGLLKPLSSMPADLRAHVKYPDDFLNWQAAAYQRYHVTDITSYYNGDNEWDIENSSVYDWNNDSTNTQPVSPIWTVARLFGQTHDSFFSILPFSVRGKATMAGYIAADNNTYHVTALDMPRGAQTMGVTQFESLYNQAPTISSTLTLLDQRGSQVVPGQMLVLPVGKALLYIKPLYLRSSSAQSLPQLIRVVAGTQNAVNWGYTLKSAVQNLLTQGDISNVGTSPSGSPPTRTTPQATVPPLPLPLPGNSQYGAMTDTQLVAAANAAYAAAERTPSLSEKDRDLRKVGQILNILLTRHLPNGH